MSNPVTSISSLLPKTSTTSELGDLTTITSKSLFTITHSRIITLSSSTINPTITTSPAPSSQMTSLDTEATNPTFPAFPTLPTLTVPAIQFGAPYTEKGLSAGAKAGIAIGVIIAVLLLACLGFALLRRKRGKSAIPSWRDRRKAAHPAGISELPTTSKREDTQDVPVFTGIDAVPSKKKWWSPRDIIASPVFEKPSRSDTKKFPAENIAELDAAPPEARKAELPGNDVPRPKGTTSSIREGDVRILSPNFYPDFGDMTVGRESRVTMIGLGDEIGVYLREMDRVEESNGEVKEYGNGDKALGRGRDVLSENMEMLRVKKELERREGGT
ncbi:hypothetical protein BGZ60DRAFT_522854 [Tricladium varicosporioides]|nr:hypothetical protein BGZ60DRAFT_522854 [Hymenoscyphus varicosporioides]